MITKEICEMTTRGVVFRDPTNILKLEPLRCSNRKPFWSLGFLSILFLQPIFHPQSAVSGGNYWLAGETLRKYLFVSIWPRILTFLKIENTHNPGVSLLRYAFISATFPSYDPLAQELEKHSLSDEGRQSLYENKQARSSAHTVTSTRKKIWVDLLLEWECIES
jgi:hypothetical protein